MKLSIRNFKCFSNQDIQIKPLTVLVGTNGSGKTTVIQSLLLLKQFFDKVIANSKSAEINLQDVFAFNLGQFEDNLNENVNNEFSFKLTDDNLEEFSVAFNSTNDSHYGALGRKANKKLTDFWLNNNLYFLSAERMGPRQISQVLHYEFPNCGIHGENTAGVLSKLGLEFKVDNSRIFNDPAYSESNRLKNQTTEWMNYLLPGTKVDYANVHGLPVAHLRFSKDSANYVSSTGTGFGLTYVLPIIVNGLVAAPNSIFIVESPESHLHPKAQSRLGEFLTKLVLSGINVIIETHSEHIITGIQKSILNNTIKHDSAIINYFDSHGRKSESRLTEIYFDEMAKIDKWPEGFFDQKIIDMRHIIKLRRSNG